MQTMPARGSLSRQLPLFAPISESPRDVDFHALSRPAGSYTGDFYFTHRHGDTLWVVVGDVMGKGLQAAVIMEMIQEELEERIAACAAAHCDPAVTMARLDLFLRSVLAGNQFATAIIVQIRDSGSMVVANAGHCPPLIARAGGHVETIGSTGPVIGLLPNAAWRSIEVPFRRGETFLAYTDGVTEARSASEDEFGMHRLRETFAAAVGETSARAVGTAIAAAVHQHSGTRRDDDLTLVVARR